MNLIGRLGLMDKLRRAERILDTIELPGYGVGLVSCGFIVKLRISRDGEYLGVYVNLRAYSQECLYCSTISEWALSKALLRARNELIKELGFRDVYFIDALLNRLITLGDREYKLII